MYRVVSRRVIASDLPVFHRPTYFWASDLAVCSHSHTHQLHMPPFTPTFNASLTTAFYAVLFGLICNISLYHPYRRLVRLSPCHPSSEGGVKSARAAVCVLYCTQILLAHLRLPPRPLRCVQYSCAVPCSCPIPLNTTPVSHPSCIALGHCSYSPSALYVPFVLGSVLLGTIGSFLALLCHHLALT